MADDAESSAALLANRFTTATMEEKKVELSKFIAIKRDRVETLREELRAREDELALLKEQLEAIARAEQTEAWLTGEADPDDPQLAELNADLERLGLIDDLAVAVEGDEDVDTDAIEAADVAYVPPVFPEHVVEQIKAEAKEARSRPQPLPAEFADDRWVQAMRPTVQDAVETAPVCDVVDAVSLTANATEVTTHTLVFGLNQLRLGWSKIAPTDTYKLAMALTAETFLDVKTEIDRLLELAAGTLGLPANHGIVVALTRVQESLVEGIAAMADATTYRRAVVVAVDVVEKVAMAAGTALADLQAQADMDAADDADEE
ncbi:hypothetical protein GGF31_004802 [Allomyces arbusculus]|nr:hypothetical protein GGF31_004802 [Allomyces arbusculus]